MQQPPYQQPGQQPYQQPGQQSGPYQQPGQYPGSQPYQQPQQAYQQPYQQPGYPQAYQQAAVPMVAAQQKDWLVTLLLCLFGGWLGVHSFYTGKILFGVLQLLTVGGCGIWTLVDLIMIITDNYKDGNGLPLLKKQ